MQGSARRTARATAVAVLLLVALVAAGLVRDEPAGGDASTAVVDLSGVLAALERAALLLAVVVLLLLSALLVDAIRSGRAPARTTDGRSLLRRTLSVVLVVYLVSLVATRVLPRLLSSAGGGAVADEETPVMAADAGVDGALWPLVVLLATAAVALMIVWWTRAPRDAAGLADEVRVAAEAALARLHAGEVVDDVVLDAYRRLEERLAAAGVRRRRSETSAELLLRALHDVDVDADAARKLGALYERVRFGGRPAGDAERAEARAALAALGAQRPGEVAAGG